MQFLAPIFWIASIALAVPIFLHLTRREVKRPAVFPSVMFLRKIPVHELRRRRIRQLPLLLLRCLAVLLLVAAFAHPVLNSSWLGRESSAESRSTLLLVDNSLSVSRPEVWSQVLSVVREEINGLGDGDEASVVQFGETAAVVWNWDRRRQPLMTAVRNRLKPSFSGTSFSAGLRRATEMLAEASNPRQELCLITDLQANGLDSGDQAGLVIPALTRFRLKAVGEDSPNSYVDQVRLNREVFESEYPYSIQAQVISSSPSRNRLQVALYLEEELIDRRTCDLGDTGKGTVQFSPFALSPGLSRGRILVEGEDTLPEDDVFHFVLERREPFVVTILQGRGAAPVYFQEALSSGRNLPFRVNQVEAISELSVADSPVLVMDNVAIPPSAMRLQSYVEDGGGVIVCPGNDTDASKYSGQWQAILPVALKGREFAHGRLVPFFKIDEANWEHPVLAGVRESLSEVRFYGHWVLDAAQPGQVVARFNNGLPALVESSLGEGRVLVFAASLGRVWSDFPVSNAYLPFWQRMVQYAAGWHPRSAALCVNQVLLREEGAANRAGEWEVLDPRGRRLFALNDKSPRSVLLEIPGQYEIRSERKTDWVAVNSSRLESDLTRLDPAEMMAVLEASREKGPVKEEFFQGEAPQQSLWGLILLCALLLLVVEALLANGIIGSPNSMTTNLRSES